MDGEPRPEPSAERTKTSPWPLVIVLGLVLSEVGILFNLYPVSVGGLLLFVGGIAGIVREAGYVTSPWRLVAGLGMAFAALGLLVVSTQVDGGPTAYLSQVFVDDGVSRRGYTVAATGAVLAVAGGVLSVVGNQ